MIRKQNIFFVIMLIFLLNSFYAVKAVDFNSSQVSTWTKDNWQQVSEMSETERDLAWERALAEQKNNLIKELTSREVTSGGILGFGTKKETIKIESIKGFDSQFLKWYPGDNAKKIIGDGNTYLDLETIPIDIKALEYKNGEFILTKKDGTKIVIEELATDKNGKLKAFPYKDIKDSKGLNDLEIKLGKNGEVRLTNDGFKIIGDGTQVKIKDLIFERKAGEKIDESYVKIGKDRYVLKGVEFKKENWVIVKPTSEEFIVNFGSYENLADYVAFRDVDGKWTYVQFDKRGRITSIARDKINNGNWIPISTSTKGLYMQDIYKSSGDTVKKIIEESQKAYVEGGEILGLDYLKSNFYNDKELKSYAQEISIETLYKNFLSINGLSFEVGGSGDIEVLRELTGISAIDPVNFNVKVGDIPLMIDPEGIHYPTKSVKNSFKIDDISVIKDGKVYGDSFTITGNSEGSKIVSKSNYFVAGRESHLVGPGISTDVHIDILQEHLDWIKKQIESKGYSGYYSDYLANALMQSEFSLKADFVISQDALPDILKKFPGYDQGLTLTGEQFRTLIYEPFIKSKIEEKIPGFSVPVDGEEKILRQNTIDAVTDLIKVSLDNTDKIIIGRDAFNTGKFTFGFQNNPGENPSLILGLPGGEVKNIPLADKTNGPQTATFARDILEAAIRAPASEKGGITSYTGFSFFVGGPDNYVLSHKGINQYWPRDYLRRLWYQNFGKGSNEWDRMLGPGDEEFFKSPDGFLNKYFQNK